MFRIAILLAALMLLLSLGRADAQFSGGGSGGGCPALLLSAGTYTCTIGTNGCATSCSGGGSSGYVLAGGDTTSCVLAGGDTTTCVGD